MTDEEALKLMVGDPLVSAIVGKLAFLEVSEPVRHFPNRRVYVYVRRVGKTHRGNRFPSSLHPADELTRMPRPDVPTVNVVADWLDEHDEPRAAQKLRRAFPLS